jgi:hypothetical protein
LERWLGAPTIDLLMIAMPIMLIDFTGLSCLTKAHGRRGDDSGRWTAWASVWWAKWWWWCPGFFGRVDGDNRATRDPGVGGTLAMTGNDSSQIAFRVPGLVIAGGLRYWAWRDSFWGKILAFQRQWRRRPRVSLHSWGVIMGTFSAEGSEQKPLSTLVSMTAMHCVAWRRSHGALVSLGLFRCPCLVVSCVF